MESKKEMDEPSVVTWYILPTSESMEDAPTANEPDIVVHMIIKRSITKVVYRCVCVVFFFYGTFKCQVKSQIIDFRNVK